MITTGCFYNLSSIKIPVSIAAYQPSGYTGPRLTILAPSPDLLLQVRSGRVSIAEYENIYRSTTLIRYRAQYVYDWIVSQYSDHATLVGGGVNGIFCHRRVIASWFEEHLGILVPELEPPGEQIFIKC